MAYTPINWQTGDTITAEKMNKMDNGWEVESTQLFSETVTTVAGQNGNSAALAYSTFIDAPTIAVTFDGTDYVCDVIDFMFKYYGGFTPMGLDPTDYPFYIESTGQANNIYTETAGTYTVSASMPAVVISDDFKDAVKTATGGLPPLLCVSGVTTSDEIEFAYYTQKRMLYFENLNDNSFSFVHRINFTTDMDATITFYPEAPSVSANITNGIFVVTES